MVSDRCLSLHKSAELSTVVQKQATHRQLHGGWGRWLQNLRCGVSFLTPKRDVCALRNVHETGRGGLLPTRVLNLPQKTPSRPRPGGSGRGSRGPTPRPCPSFAPGPAPLARPCLPRARGRSRRLRVLTHSSARSGLISATRASSIPGAEPSAKESTGLQHGLEPWHPAGTALSLRPPPVPGKAPPCCLGARRPLREWLRLNERRQPVALKQQGDPRGSEARRVGGPHQGRRGAPTSSQRAMPGVGPEARGVCRARASITLWQDSRAVRRDHGAQPQPV